MHADMHTNWSHKKQPVAVVKLYTYYPADNNIAGFELSPRWSVMDADWFLHLYIIMNTRVIVPPVILARNTQSEQKWFEAISHWQTGYL